MRKLLALMTMLALAALAASGAGCGAGSGGGSGGGKPAPPPQNAGPSYSPQAASWAYAPKALELTLTSDPFLNEYDGAAHALPVCVYQLSNPAAFGQLASSASGLSRLMECQSFDGSVVGAQRVTVQPGLSEVLRLDRSENTKFVAIACAYYDRNLASATKVYEIPLSASSSGWLWWKETTYGAGKLAKKILLGKGGIVSDGDGS